MGSSTRRKCVVPMMGLIRRNGFTLIELMVAVAIIGILSSIAYPAYQNHVRRASRAEAKGILLETAQVMERNYTVNGCYHRTDGACTDATSTGGGAMALPYAHSPKTGTAKYTITVAFPSASPCALGSCFTLSATPAGTMTGDECGTYTLTQAGVQGSGGTAADCWQR